MNSLQRATLAIKALYDTARVFMGTMKYAVQELKYGLNPWHKHNSNDLCGPDLKNPFKWQKGRHMWILIIANIWLGYTEVTKFIKDKYYTELIINLLFYLTFIAELIFIKYEIHNILESVICILFLVLLALKFYFYIKNSKQTKSS